MIAKYALAHKGETFHAEVGDVIADRLPSPEDAVRDLATIGRALAAVGSGKRGAYQAALRLLDEGTMEAWEAEVIDGADPDAGGYERNADGLTEFLEANRSWLEHCIEDVRNAPDVTAQVHGMAIDIRDLERIARIETHLDAKMQRLLGLLQHTKKALPKLPR